jgi:prolyl-tRNA editing enzyme YbaK/EbsC (Cys-tRNA(Pro) deacylase)
MTRTLCTPDDLQAFIEANQLSAQLLRDVGATPTVPDAAAVLGVASEQIAKTLLFLIDKPGAEHTASMPVIVISHGERRVDRKRLARHFAVSNGRVRLAAADVVLELLGYPAGGVPPFGHRTRLPCILDASMVAAASQYDGVFFGGGGDDRTMLRLTIEELIRVVSPQIVEVS